jgi:hypothetical protein
MNSSHDFQAFFGQASRGASLGSEALRKPFDYQTRLAEDPECKLRLVSVRHRVVIPYFDTHGFEVAGVEEEV